MERMIHLYSEIEAVLQAMNLQSDETRPITNRLFKIKVKDQQMALKKSRLKVKDIGKWQAVYQSLYQHKINEVVPLYYLNNHLPYYNTGTDIYYIMPWIEAMHTEQPIDEYSMVAHTLGKLHATTLVTYPIDSIQKQKEFIEPYYMNILEEYKQKMLEHVRYFESKRFMAPHELQICMYYKDIEIILQQLVDWSNIHVEALEETEQIKNTLCHGNIRPSHYIVRQDSVLLLNWESAFRSSPIYDLATYYLHLFQYQDCDLQKVSDAYQIYCQYLRLSDYEKSGLAIRLLSIENWMHVMEVCTKDPVRENSISLSIKIEEEYRKLLFSLQLQNTIFQSLQKNVKDEESILESNGDGF